MDLIKLFSDKKKKLALLIDPDRTPVVSAVKLISEAYKNNFSFILIGGSLVSEKLDEYISVLKNKSKLPIVLFPGSVYQVSLKADGMLFLSLISGRNPDYLIGQHVIAAPIINKSKLQVIPTGYILIESGSVTAVEYMSNTKPIPATKPDIICATALAGEMLGLKMIYLEAGSGANKKVHSEIIKQVRNTITVPLIVGGGIHSPAELKEVFKAGANIAVIGTAIEKKPELLKEFGKILT